LEKEGIIKCKDKKFKGSTVKTINEIDFEHKMYLDFNVAWKDLSLRSVNLRRRRKLLVKNPFL
jgi:hypothetical protein